MNVILNIIVKILLSLYKYIPINFLIHHKIQNKFQITNMNIILMALQKKKYKPKYIFDIGCGHGEWFKKSKKIFKNSKFLLFDGNSENLTCLTNLKKNYKNLNFFITLLSKNVRKVNFYKMGYGSSIYEENTKYKRIVESKSTEKLSSYISKFNICNKNNLIKLDVQGSELDILKGLGKYIDLFEVVILEVSLMNYNKNSPLFYEVINFMNKKNYILHDMCDLKRLGFDRSFLIQFDALFLRKNSFLLKNIKFN